MKYNTRFYDRCKVFEEEELFYAEVVSPIRAPVRIVINLGYSSWGKELAKMNDLTYETVV